MSREEFSSLLYQTRIDSSTTPEAAVKSLIPLRDWIKNNIPTKLYRYRNVSDYSISALKNDEIWGSTIFTFNDPFECTPCYKIEEAFNYVRIMLSSESMYQNVMALRRGDTPPPIQSSISSDVIDELRKNILAIPEKALSAQIDLVINQLFDKIVAEWNPITCEFFTGFQAAESEVHIACFSEIGDSSLMWGHYANCHKGFCLEYDFSSVLRDCSMNCSNLIQCNNFLLNLPIAPVTYSPERFNSTMHLVTVIQDYLRRSFQLPINIFLYDMLLVAKCQLMKSNDWCYEKEWRLARREPSDKYEAHRLMAHLKPSAIYLGSRMPLDDQAHIFKISQQKEIPCFKMLQNYSGQDYTLISQPYEEYLDKVQQVAQIHGVG